MSQTASQLETLRDQVQGLACAAVARGSWRTWTLRIAVAVLAPLTFLALVEAGLRIAGVGFPTDVTVPCTVKGRPANCYNLFFAAPFFPPGMIKTPQVYAIPAVKAPRTYRIFVLGESAAMGDPDPAYAFSRYLEVMLKEEFPQMKFEVVNTGIVAINSHVLLRMAEGLAQYQPDLFIIYAGNNEVVGPYGPGTAFSSSVLRLPIIRASIFVRSTRIGQVAARITQPKQQWRGMEMFLDKQVRGDAPGMRRVYENFAANLNDIIAIANKAGARVVISTVATNLKDCAPFASLHRDGISKDDLRSWSALVQQGTELEGAGRYRDALKQYRSAADIDDSYADVHFRIAHILWALGDFSAAKEQFVRARDLDSLRFRTDSKMNDVIRSVAASWGSKVEFVDAEAVLASGSPHGIIGSELLYEHVHLNPAGNYTLASALFPKVIDKLPPRERYAAVNRGVLSEEECERLLALTNYDRARAEKDVIQRLLQPPFTNRLNNLEELQKLYAKIEVRNDAPEDTSAQYQWAITRHPDDQLLHFNYGVFLDLYDPVAAEQQFREARPFDGFPLVTSDGGLH